MKTNVTQLHGITPDELKNEIISGVQDRLNLLEQQLQNQKSTEYLTRKEVSELLGVSLVTIHEWCKKGILRPYRIGHRVRFKQKDIEETLEKSLRK